MPRTTQSRRRAVQRDSQRLETQSTKRVTRQLFHAGQPQGDEEVTQDSEVHVFVTEPAYVRINHGMTINMGDYQSLRVDVSVTAPCYVEDVEQTAERVSDYVASTLEDEVGLYNKDS